MATLKLKRSEVVILSQSIEHLMNVSQNKDFSSKFNYALSKTFRKLKGEVEDAGKVNKEKLKEYEDKRIELCKEHATKDDKGVAIKVDNRYTIPGQDAFQEAFEVLKVEYKQPLDETDLFMKEEIDAEVHQVPISIVPDLPPAIFNGIAEMVIDDPEPEPKK